MPRSPDPLKLFAWFTFVIFLLITTGCSAELVTPLPSNLADPSPSLAATITSTTTATPTPTLFSTVTPTPLPTIPPTATPIQISPVFQRCLQFQTSPPPMLNGKLVLSGFRIRPANEMAVEGDSYLLDLQSGERISLGHTRFETVSPDGKWLAYYDTEQEQVAVVDYEGRLIYETPAPQRLLWSAYWLDNQRLLLNQYIPVTSSPSGPAFALVILNPFTDERQEWSPDFPPQAYANQYWMLYSNLVFNPALTHLIYSAREEGDFPIVLWNVQSEEVIRKIYWGSRLTMPRWSPDGRYFVTDAPLRSDRTEPFINFEDSLPYQGGTELFLVNQDGDLQRLTYFTVLQERRQSGYIWARDGHRIAFYSQYRRYPPDLVYIDLDTGRVFDYCETRPLPENHDFTLIYPPDIVWLPEGDYLAVTFLDNEFRYTVNLVELSTGDAWQIGEDLSVMGWMVSP
jgi:WD40 repeat protein